MISIKSIFRVAQQLLLAVTLVASFAASAADVAAPPPAPEKSRGSPYGYYSMSTNSPGGTTDAPAEKGSTDKVGVPPPPQSYCVCCAKSGPYTVTASTLPSPNFAAACKAHGAGPVWSVVHVGPMACSCKGIKGPKDDLKKYVQ